MTYQLLERLNNRNRRPVQKNEPFKRTYINFRQKFYFNCIQKTKKRTINL